MVVPLPARVGAPRRGCRAARAAGARAVRTSRARRTALLALALASLAPGPAAGELPLVPGSAIGASPLARVAANAQLVSGTAFVGYRGADGQTTGGIATVTPWRASFVRVGAELTPTSENGSARFLWGLGFEDPRDGTFFVHLHDWGPARPSGGSTLARTEVSVGYKLPRLCGGAFCAATIASATTPLAGGPYVTGSLTLEVARTWFATGTLGWSVPGALDAPQDPRRWRISYALGRWDGSPGGLFVTYQDELRLVALRDARASYRQGNGVVAMGVNWAY